MIMIGRVPCTPGTDCARRIEIETENTKLGPSLLLAFTLY
jgi:hypothetical protein